MSEESTKSPIDKLLDDLSVELEKVNQRQQKLTTGIKVLVNLKNNPVDEFNEPLTKEYEQNCMNKCTQILNNTS